MIPKKSTVEYCTKCNDETMALCFSTKTCQLPNCKTGNFKKCVSNNNCMKCGKR